MNIAKIKCPCCGAVLTIRQCPNIERMSITCPVCKEKSPYTKYKAIVEKEEKTEYGDDEHTRYDEICDSQSTGINRIIGRLKYELQYYDLKEGINVIGRKSQGSSADVQLQMGDNRCTSREHLNIEVREIPGIGYVHYASLYKEQVNDTFINDEKLLYGDKIKLSDGDILKFPNTEVIFEISEI